MVVDIVSVHPREIKAVATVLAAAYFALAIAIALKIYFCLKNSWSPCNYKILWLYTVILTISFCKCYTVRVFFWLEAYLLYSTLILTIIQTLVLSTYEILGYSFINFWIFIYTEFSVEINQSQKHRIDMIATITNFFISVCTYTFYLLISFQDFFGFNNIMVFYYANIIIAIILSILLLIIGKLLIKRLSLLFTGQISISISRRLKTIIFSSCIIYISKAVCIVTIPLIWSISTDPIRIFCFFLVIIFGELLPLISVLIFVKPARIKDNRSSSIPDVFLTNETITSNLEDLLKTFSNSSLISSLAVIKATCINNINP